MMRFLRNMAGASAAEFALVLPAALLILFGVIDVGRYAWHLNQYEKAVQLGARYAVATRVVAGDLKNADYTVANCSGTPLKAGDLICPEAMQTVVCTSTSCSCQGTGSVCSSGGYDAAAFQQIGNRMYVASKRISLANITVQYAPSGIGYVGDPTLTSDCVKVDDGKGNKVPPATCQLPDAAPIVTVKLTGLRYYPITLSLLGVGVPYPPFTYSLTMEDADGAVAS